jgi:hypothetical protein
MLRWGLLAMAAACGADEGGEVVGPFTGETRRFVVDEISLPASSMDAYRDAADLDGDDVPDNQLGSAIVTLSGSGNVTPHGASMIAAGVLASVVEITADDFTDDATVGVRYLGRDGVDAVEVGGRLSGGVFVSNRTRETDVPGSATVVLPVFADADPSAVPLIGMEIEMTADGDGGFDAIVRGGVPAAPTMMAAYAGIAQMIDANPTGHLILLGLLDTPPRDYAITYEEFATNDLMVSLLGPDTILGDVDVLSLAFRAHFAPCPAGRCTDAPTEPCFDRVLDGDETDVDCGGSCGPCRTDAMCGDGADCDSQACDAGACRAPTCSDGLRDGFETDVDCGSLCGGCELGQRCWYGSDCASGQCGVPCAEGDWDCIFDIGFDTCMPAAPAVR